MISANISKQERKAIYKRDGYRCALCDSTRYLQIHHHIPRGQGGTNSPHNLITLCSDCHALAHGTNLRDWQDVTQEDIQQACCEYLADFYAPGWNPWARFPRPCEECPRRKWCQRPQNNEACPYDVPPPNRGERAGSVSRRTRLAAMLQVSKAGPYFGPPPQAAWP